ncbi:MAG: hypothetical protein EOO88_01760 [Pedobacter sp.]|nr:MAG: hypothetical protein EOO88_01760 [Pedobacter sp.]
MNKKHYLLFVLAAGLAMPAHAQFGKLKGLIGKKEKVEEPKPSASAERDAAAGNETTATSSDDVQAAAKAWTAEFAGGIEWFKLTPTGKLVVSANDGLYGINPVSGKTLWKHPELKGLDKENYNIIPSSPYVAIVSGGMLSMHHLILDVTDGRVVSDTKELGVKYVNKRFVVPSLNGILFSGMDNKGWALIMTDAGTGKKLWSLQSIFESNSEILTARPLAVDGQHIMLATTKRIYKVNTTAGTVVWKADFKTQNDKGTLATEAEAASTDKASSRDNDKKGPGIMGMAGKVPGLGGFGGLAKMGSMGAEMRNGMAQSADDVFGKFIVLDNIPQKVFYYTNTTMTAFDLNSGAPAWTTVKFDDPISTMIQDERGFLIATNDKNSELMLLDYASGQQKWAPVKLSGKVTAIKLNGDKLAVASAKSSGTNLVNIININSGKPVSSSALKVSGQINDIRISEQGLVYRTSRETNIQDINSGKDVWPSSISYKEGGGLGVDAGNQTYVWGGNQLYLLDQQSGKYQALGKGLKFGGDEQANHIEMREKGILISSDQNIALLDKQGNVIYHVYQAAPGISTFGKIMNITAMSISAGQSASHGFQSGYSGGQGSSTGRSEMDKSDRWSNISSAALADMSRRFKASQGANNYIVMLTKVKTADDNGIGLVRVNKDSGKIESKVVLDDKKPDYIADDVENMVFYKSGNKALTGYKF